MKVIIAVVVASLVGFGGIIAANQFLTESIVTNVDPEKVRVEQWLRENLPDGKWHEIHWYPGITLAKQHVIRIQELEFQLAAFRSELEGIQHQISQSTDNEANTKPSRTELQRAEVKQFGIQSQINKLEKQLTFLNSSPPRRLCGIKIRTRNTVGANDVERLVFDVTDGDVQVHHTSTYRTVAEGLQQPWKILEETDS